MGGLEIRWQSNMPLKVSRGVLVVALLVVVNVQLLILVLKSDQLFSTSSKAPNQFTLADVQRDSGTRPTQNRVPSETQDSLVTTNRRDSKHPVDINDLLESPSISILLEEKRRVVAPEMAQIRPLGNWLRQVTPSSCENFDQDVSFCMVRCFVGCRCKYLRADR